MTFRNFCNLSVMRPYTRLIPRVNSTSYIQAQYISTTIERCSGVSLAYKLYPSAVPSTAHPIVITHGIFGSKCHWDSMAKAISEKTNRNVYALDVRNHGESPHVAEIDCFLLGEDINLFIKEHGLGKVLIFGHSMSGLGSMAAALLEPSLCSSLFVVDMSPLPTPGMANVSSIISFKCECMKRVTIPKEVTNIDDAKKYADKCLEPDLDPGDRKYILSNLVEDKDGYRWCCNLDGISNINADPSMIVEKGNKYYGKTTFVCGAVSVYATKGQESSIRELFPYTSFHYIKDAGHYMHMFKPKEFLECIIPLINASD